MLIEDIHVDDGRAVTHFVATLRWENTPRTPFEVVYTVLNSDADRASPNPDAFRIPAAIVALRDGESRLAGGGAICPILRDGLLTSLQWLVRWRPELSPPALDIPTGCGHPTAGEGGLAAALLSGGVDSLALLMGNHADHPVSDPLRISIGLVVTGIQKHRWKEAVDVQDRLNKAKEDLGPIAERTGIDLIAVDTNLRVLRGDSTFWKYEYQGAVLAGVGHLFATTISHLDIASTWQVSDIENWGSHPLIDPGFSSHSLRVWHQLAHMGRLEKTRVVARSPEVLGQLSVCNDPAAGNSNCGRCEKCIRTMLALEALEIDPTALFGRGGVEPEDLERLRIHERGLEGEYAELIDPLIDAGRPDLARIVMRRIRINRLLRLDAVKRAGGFARSLLTPRS